MNAKIVQIMERDMLKLLRLDIEQVFELKFEEGMKFLNLMYFSEGTKTALRDSKEFWNWWRSIWANRDKELMENLSFNEYSFSTLKPMPQLNEGHWLMGRHIGYEDSFKFYKEYHSSAKGGIKLYPNEEIIIAAIKQQKVKDNHEKSISK